MRTYYHLVALASSRTAVLVLQTPAGWLLPYLLVDGGLKPTIAIRRWLDHHQLEGVIVHEALLPAIDPRAHTCYALLGEVSSLPAESPLQWTPLDTLTTSTAVLAPQAEALRVCMDRVAHPQAPFDAFDTLREIRNWIARHLAERGHAIVGPLRQHKALRHEAVLEVPTTHRSVFFKGGPRRSSDEAPITQTLRLMFPEHFAETLAFDTGRGWWAAWSVPGAPLSTCCTRHSTRLVTETTAKIQKSVWRSSGVLDRLKHRELSVARLQATGDRVIALYTRGPDDVLFERADLALVHEQIHQSCSRLARLPIPASWIHSDYDGSNVYVNGERVAFVDLENGFLGPPAIALWNFFDNHGGRFTDRRAWEAEMMAVYVDCWRDVVAASTMRTALEEMPVAHHLMRLTRRLESFLALSREGEMRYTREDVGRRLAPLMRQLIDIARTRASAIAPQRTPLRHRQERRQ